MVGRARSSGLARSARARRTRGEGFGLVELAVVLEELGHGLVPGPFLTTVLAAALVLEGGDDAQRTALVPRLVDGSCIAGVALAPEAPVLCAATASLVVVPVGDEWYALDATDVMLADEPSLDLTRGVARVRVDPATLSSDRHLAQLTTARARELAVVLASAELCGVAAWCLETAAEHARTREQFGRAIGQFQGVKHRCADMLVALERSRAAVWDAARGAASPDEAALIDTVAGAVVPDATVRAAQDCLQVLGAVGFSWDHDVHLALRRAVSVRQLVGDGARWHSEVARFAIAGVTRRLDFGFDTGVDATRGDVRDLVEAVRGLDAAEQRVRLVDGGYLEPHWPRPWGRDATPAEQLVIDEELDRAGIERPDLVVGAWAAATVVGHGTPGQRERWIRPTLLGELLWCQLFSEPEAGSDLASLRTRAERVDGGWRVTGHKIWTSLADRAQLGLCLARTDPDAPKRHGITYMVVDMSSDGVEVLPLRELTGRSTFNEVLLDGVFVPDDAVLGAVGDGWRLARTTLSNERVSMGRGTPHGGGVAGLLQLVSDLELEHDPVAMDRVGRVMADEHVVNVLQHRRALRALAGAAPGPEASVVKLFGAEHEQRVEELGLALCGPQGAVTSGIAEQFAFGFLLKRSLTIAGGTSEIQRNVLAEQLLGLPRDP